MDNLIIATLLWDANKASQNYSSMYDEGWVEKLYRGFARNLSTPFDFICYSERRRYYREPIRTMPINSVVPSYKDCIQPYELNEPMILVGLDTIVCGPIDHIADYALRGSKIALPRDPYNKQVACNGVALVPGGNSDVYVRHNGENDMEWMRSQPHHFIDDLFPGQVVSFKGSVERRGIGDARIIYFHGDKKPHQLKGNPIVREHWN